MSRIKAKSIAIILALLAICAASGETKLSYNRVRWKSSHNSYAKETGIKEQLAGFRFRSIELDLHGKKDLLGIKRPPAGDWFVFHELIDTKTNCALLSGCLEEVAGFHEQNPRHHVVTIFFDIKDGLHERSGHGADDFYRALRKGLPEGSITGPGALLELCPQAGNLQEAVTMPGCGWPVLEELRGKFMLVVASGRKHLVRAGYQPKQDPVFLVNTNLTARSIEQYPHRIFFNVRGPHPFGEKIHEAGFVARAYGLDTEKDFRKAKALGFNHLAMDHVNSSKHSWAETDGETGEPYERIELPK